MRPCRFDACFRWQSACLLPASFLVWNTLGLEEGMRHFTVRLLAVAIAAASAACASSGRSNPSVAAGNVDLGVGVNRNSLPSSRELEVLKGMSDADILGHLITIDSMEVATADSALRLSRSDDVLDLAKRMRATHSANFRQDR